MENLEFIDYDEKLAEAVSDLRNEEGREYISTLTDAITGRHGSAIGEQAESILRDGEALFEQNSNALRYIAEYLTDKGHQDIADVIIDYMRDSDNLTGRGLSPEGDR